MRVVRLATVSSYGCSWFSVVCHLAYYPRQGVKERRMITFSGATKLALTLKVVLNCRMCKRVNGVTTSQHADP